MFSSKFHKIHRKLSVPESRTQLLRSQLGWWRGVHGNTNVSQQRGGAGGGFYRIFCQFYQNFNSNVKTLILSSSQVAQHPKNFLLHSFLHVINLTLNCFYYEANLKLINAVKGATKFCFRHYSRVVIILFNIGLCKSAFFTGSFGKLVCCSAIFVFLPGLCQIRCNLRELYNNNITVVYIGVRQSMFLSSLMRNNLSRHKKLSTTKKTCLQGDFELQSF